MPYEAVPRALSRLARQAREIIPMRAQAEERRARIGLAQTRQEYEIGEAKEAREHRTKVFEATEAERGERRAEREREFELEKPIKLAAGATARRKLEEQEAGEQYVTSGDLFAGLTAEDMPWVAGTVLPAYGKGAGIKKVLDPQPDGPQYTKYGKPYKRWQMKQDAELLTGITRTITGARHVLETVADATNKGHPKHEEAKKILEKGDELAVAKMDLRMLHRFPPRAGTPAIVVNMYNNRLREVNANIARLEKAKEKGKDTIKFVYWDSQGKKHSQYIGKTEVPGAEKTVRDQGGTMEKPEKQVKPTAAKQKAVLGLIDKYTAKGVNEPTAEQAAAINDAAQEIGYEYKKITGPLREQDKRWYWWDPDKKAYWTLRRKTTEKPPEGPAAPPAGMLKEGTRTTFKNGQVWTLKNGVPTLIGETGIGRRKITR